MKSILNHFKKMDFILLGSALVLCLFGLVSLFSIGHGKGDYSNFQKQLLFFGIGIAVMVLVSFIDWRTFRDNPYLLVILYLVCLLALAGLFVLAPRIRGIKSWYRLGGFSLSPIEFTKIILILLLAKYFSNRHVEMYRLRHILLSGFYVALPCLLVFLQPDLGSVIIMVVVWVGVLAVSGIKLRHFLLLLICGVLVVGIGWSFFLHDYQKQRVIAYFSPQKDVLGSSWSQTQAKIAIGNGGIFGQGFEKGSQTQLGFLPEPHTDFIFSAIAEEFGLVGILIMFAAFLVLVWRVIKIALVSRTNFPRLFAVGFALILVSHFFINVGMNLGLLPVIGISLQFMSYGGSAILAMFLGLGILQSIKVNE